MAPLDSDRIREDFPILQPSAGERRLVYLDGASTAQKPRAVIERVSEIYTQVNAKPHRAIHELGERATRILEAARMKVQRFVHAAEPREVVFTRGTTESINLVARGSAALLQRGDEVIVTAMEHHSGLVPWQAVAAERGALLRIAPIDPRGEIDLEALERLLGPRTRVLSLPHVSHVLGTVNPVKRIARMAHDSGAVVLVDGAMGAPHTPVDVRDLDCDFYAFSGHKLYGPAGTGVLYGKAALLEKLSPLLVGGDMVRSVNFEKTEYAPLPHRLEAGTPNLEGIVGLAAAIDYVGSLGLESVFEHERGLLRSAEERLRRVPGLAILGDPAERAGSITFVLEGVHAHDIAAVLDEERIAIRAGHLCAQPLLDLLGLPAAVRASVGLYNTADDIDRLEGGIRRAAEVFRG
ncbi:MAG TPA: cysteine desulfurase [Planctomycetota bacterium]|nr:cysteine desulfurase [Planctomycetota bacterium]